MTEERVDYVASPHAQCVMQLSARAIALEGENAKLRQAAVSVAG